MPLFLMFDQPWKQTSIDILWYVLTKIRHCTEAKRRNYNKSMPIVNRQISGSLGFTVLKGNCGVFCGLCPQNAPTVTPHHGNSQTADLCKRTHRSVIIPIYDTLFSSLRWRADPSVGGNVVQWRTLPARPARTTPFQTIFTRRLPRLCSHRESPPFTPTRPRHGTPPIRARIWWWLAEPRAVKRYATTYLYSTRCCRILRHGHCTCFRQKPWHKTAVRDP